MRAPPRLAADKGQPDAINPHYLMAELGKVLDDEDIIFNEAVRNTPAVLMQIPRRLPNTTVRDRRRRPRLVRRHGARRQARGAGPAHGAGDRRRQLLLRRPVLGVRDRAAIQAADFLHRARQFRLGGGQGGDACASIRTAKRPPPSDFHAELAPVEFSKIGEAFGAHAEKVSDPAGVPDAIARCAAEVRRGRSALLHARVTRL